MEIDSKLWYISASVFSGLSLAMAFSNAIFFTILLHSTNFFLASSSFGRRLATISKSESASLNFPSDLKNIINEFVIINFEMTYMWAAALL